MVLDIGALEDAPTDVLPGFTEQLLALLPGLRAHQCSRGHEGGFVERLVEGTWTGHVSEHVALELQRTAGHEMTRGKTRSTGARGVYNVIYGYLDETVATLAGRLAVKLVNHLVSVVDARRTRPAGVAVDDRLRFPGRARGVPANQPAGRLRAFHPGHPRGGDRPRHPLAAAQFRLAGATRTRQTAAAHPGHHDLDDGLAGGGHRLGQGTDQPAAGGGRPARCPPPKWSATTTTPSGWPGGSAIPWCSSRWTATTAAAWRSI